MERNAIHQALARALEDTAFQPGELVYLALTSKPEFQVRDRIAWRLYTDGWRAAREWKYADLAVLDENGAPLALVEAKALHTFDAVRPDVMARKHAPNIRGDLEKAHKLAPDAQLFALVVVTHGRTPVGKELRNLVKYDRELSRATDYQAAEVALSDFLRKLGPVHRVQLQEGSAFGIEAAVESWLCGPVQMPLP